MKLQSEKKKTGMGNTVSITVSISQDSRKKLREMKGILGYNTLDNTVNTAVDMVEMRSVFNIAMKAHGLETQVLDIVESKDIPKETEGSAKEYQRVNTVPTHDSSNDHSGLFSWLVDEIVISSTISENMTDVKLEDINDEYVKNLLKEKLPAIFNCMSPKVSPVGEISGNIPEWEE